MKGEVFWLVKKVRGCSLVCWSSVKCHSLMTVYIADVSFEAVTLWHAKTTVLFTRRPTPAQQCACKCVYAAELLFPRSPFSHGWGDKEIALLSQLCLLSQRAGGTSEPSRFFSHATSPQPACSQSAGRHRGIHSCEHIQTARCGVMTKM